MTWDDLEQLIRDRARQQPRGYTNRLAEKLGVSRAAVSGWLTGQRPVPREHVPAVLDSLGLELAVVNKQNDGSKAPAVA